MRLGFYEYLIIVIFVALVCFYVFTIISKFYYDKRRVWYDREKNNILVDINSFISFADDKEFKELLKKFIDKYKNSIESRKFSDLMEEVLIEIIEQNTEKASRAREIAFELEFPVKSLDNLCKNDIARILKGCIQAKSYIYKPAIPYLLKHLNHSELHLQYDILLALSRFDDPESIAKAFEIIKKRVLVNERTVREIVNWTSLQNRVKLFSYILEMKSDILSTMFLKCMDKDSANALKDKFIPLFSKETTQELRIATIKAMSVTQDHELVPYLITALEDSDWELRAVAAKGLENIPDERALQPLIKAICDKEWWVRQNAALAILSFENPKEGIIQVLKTNDRYAKESLSFASQSKNISNLVSGLQYIENDKKETSPINMKI